MLVECIDWKIFEEEILMGTFPTTLLQIFCEIILNSHIIVKSVLDPDDNFTRSIYGLTGTSREQFQSG